MLDALKGTRMKSRIALWIAAVIASAALLVVNGSAVAQPPTAFGPSQPQAGKQWALLIGVEKYQRAPPLRYTINDVMQLSKTLSERGGVEPWRILEITDDGPSRSRQPWRETLLAEVPRWLARPAPEDEIVVFFSGHGFRDSDGRMYLAPLDCDAANPAPSGISVEWLREQLSACRARFKLLVLDACHAGSEKGEAVESVGAKDLGERFRDLPGVFTLASSTGEEKSQLWEEKQQSLFTYWLNQGLKGHADNDSDGDVDVDELNEYVYRNVTHTAQVRFSRPQTPVRIVRAGRGVPVIMKLQPLGLKQVLLDMAEQLSWAMEERKLAKVGVLEFTNDTKLGELLGADYGLLGRYCAEELEQRLTKLSADKYSVVDRRRLQAALSQEQFSIERLASTAALEKLASQAGGMPAVACGMLRNRAGRVVTLQCKLLRTDADDVAASAGGTALLSESEWAMLGKSAVVDPSDRLPPPPSLDKDKQPDPADQVVAGLDQKSQGPHPLTNPRFPFPIRIMVGGKERPMIPKGNDMLLPLRNGEEYEIWIENRAGRMVLMRLLVDGLNTMWEPEVEKGINTFVVGKRVNLQEARHWILDPSTLRTPRKVWAVRGFVSKTGEQGEVRKFTVVDADKSLAARQKFTDNIGLITIALYENQAARNVGIGSAIGTDAGQAIRQDIAVVSGTKCGNLIAALNIKYIDADAQP